MLQEHLTSCLIIVNTGKWDKILLQACLNFCSFGWVYIVCVCSQVAAPIAYAAPAVTKYAAPALGYAAFGSYGLDYLHWSIAQVHTHTHTHTHTYIHTYIHMYMLSWRHTKKQHVQTHCAVCYCIWQVSLVVHHFCCSARAGGQCVGYVNKISCPLRTSNRKLSNEMTN